MGLSFDTISGSGPNGAIIHYKPEPETCAMVTSSQMYLLDSGGQYMDGTTDVTRTMHFGTPMSHEKHHYTLVLKSHIAIDSVEFPVGTTGYLLDVVARQGMWKEGLDYKHGTGHGVGVFLNVHEGPHGIGFRVAYNDTPLQAGMIVTNGKIDCILILISLEPGLYFEGEYGIRIENVVKCVKVRDGFLGFRPVTYVPMFAGLIEMETMTKSEIEWVNAYHEECFKRVEGLLEKNSLGYEYLLNAVKPLV